MRKDWATNLPLKERAMGKRREREKRIEIDSPNQKSKFVLSARAKNNKAA